MPLKKKGRLFHQKDNNLLIALRENHYLKGLRKGPISSQALKKIISNFEEIGELIRLQWGEWLRISNEKAEEVAFPVVERLFGYSRTSVRRPVSRNLSFLFSTFLFLFLFWSIIIWYPFKFHVVQALNFADLDTRTKFARMVLTRIAVDNAWPWNILWRYKAHFALDRAVNTVTYGVLQILIICMSSLCILITLLYEVVLRLTSFFVPLFE